MNNAGQKLVQCLSAISAYGKEIDALRETLNELFVKEIATLVSANKIACKPCGNRIYSERKDDHLWIFTDLADSFPLMGQKGKNVPQRYLSFQISLIGDGMSFDNGEPLLHVSLWDEPINFDDEYCMGYPLERDESLSIESQRLLVWGGRSEDWKSASWTFSVRLLTLDSSQALLDRVIEPALKLLLGESALIALPDNLVGLILYPNESAIYEVTGDGIEMA